MQHLASALIELYRMEADATARRAFDLLSGTLGDAHFQTREAEQALKTIGAGPSAPHSDGP
jgi:hypothetical protein